MIFMIHIKGFNYVHISCHIANLILASLRVECLCTLDFSWIFPRFGMVYRYIYSIMLTETLNILECYLI